MFGGPRDCAHGAAGAVDAKKIGSAFIDIAAVAGQKCFLQIGSVKPFPMNQSLEVHPPRFFIGMAEIDQAH
jgi:hypothetical protein